ncbi:MAG: DnaJ domain-containing protein [bacterium]|nr:DnaJ domain-containing protein [bacterium]
MIRGPYHNDKGKIIDYYEVLSIPYKAKKELIRSAFCNLIKHYHPDISGKNSDKDKKITDLLIKGYKVLINDNLRSDYNKQLFSELRFNEMGYVYLPKTRVKYSISLKDLLATRLLNKKIKHKDRIYKFGQDVEIFLTPQEIQRGAIAVVELPSRKNCYICYGEDPYCHICNGVGRIPGASNLEVKISPNTPGGTFVDVDLMKVRPDRFTIFRMRTLRVKISIIGKSKPVSVY